MVDDIGKGRIVIEADASGVPKDIQKQTPAAKKAGADVGESAGEALEKEFSKAVREGSNVFSKEWRDAAAKAGKSITTRLNEATKKVEVSLSDLGDDFEKDFSRAVKRGANVFTKEWHDAARKAGRSISLQMNEASKKAEVYLNRIDEKMDDVAEDRHVTIEAEAETKGAAAQLMAASRDRIVNFHAKVSGNIGAELAAVTASISGSTMLNNWRSSVVGLLTNVPALTKQIALLGGAFSSLVAPIGSAMSSLGPLAVSLGQIVPIIAVAPAAFLAMGTSIGVVTAAFKGLEETTSTAGKQFYSLIEGIKTDLKGLQVVIQDNFFKEFTTPFQELVDTLLPQVQAKIGGVAAAMGGVLGGIASGITAAFSGGQLETFLSRLTSGITSAVPGFQSIFTALGNIAVKGSETFGGFGEWITRIGAQFESWADKADISGMINLAVQQMGYLFDAAGAVLGIVKGIFTAADTGKSTGLQSLAETLQAVSDVVNGPVFQEALGTVFDGMAAGATALQQALGPIGNALAELAPTIGYIIQTLAGGAADALTNIAEALSQPVAQEGIKTAIEAVATMMSNLDFAAAGQAIGALGEAIGAMAPMITKLVNALLPYLPPIIDMVTRVIGVFAEMPVGIQLATVAFGGLTAGLFKMIPVFSQLATGFGLMKTFLTTTTVGMKLASAGTKVWSVVTKIAGVVARGFGVALRFMTGPVGLIITAIAALVAALVWFFTKTKTGKAIVTAVWTAIQTAVAAVADWFSNTFVPMMSAVWEGIKAGLSGIGSFFSTVWNAIKTAAQTVVAWFQENVAPVFAAIWEGIKSGLQVLGSIFASIWNGIKVVVDVAITAIALIIGTLAFVFQSVWNGLVVIWNAVGKPLFDFIKLYIQTWVLIFKVAFNLIKAGFTAVWNGMKAVWNAVGVPVFEAIKTALGAVWTWISANVVERFKSGWRGIGNVFAAVRDRIITIWNAVRDALKVVWDWIKEHIFGSFKKSLYGWQLAFRVVKDAVLRIWNRVKEGLKAGWDWIKKHVMGAFNTALTNWKNHFATIRDLVLGIWTRLREGLKAGWDWISKHVLGAFRRGLTNLRERFSAVKIRIGEIWDGLKDKLKNVWDWISEKVFGPMKRGVNAVKEAFRSAKDGIGRIWAKVKGLVKAPVKFVVETIYNDGIRVMANKVLGWLGKDKLGRVPTKGWATGGYTGPGAKYQPAGIVHAGEYVVNKASRQKFEQRAPGALDHLNRTGELPGYAQGGSVQRLIQGIKWWQSKGARVLEFKPWTGVSPVHMQGSMHYLGRAADLNYGPGGTNSIEQGFFDSNLAAFRKAFPDLHTLWRVAGHFNHLHLDNRIGDGTGKPGTGGGGGLPFDPFGVITKLKNLRNKLAGQMFQSPFGQALKGGAERLINGPINWIREQVGNLGGKISDTAGGIASAAKNAGVSGIVKAVAMKYGSGLSRWGMGAQWDAIAHIIDRESGWNPKAANPNSSARGLFQKMTSIHGPIESSVAGQAQWGLNYIRDRYGSPVKAWEFWKRNHHYDAGGWLPSGGFGFNTSGSPEAVLNPAQSAALVQMSKSLTRPSSRSDAGGLAAGSPGTVVRVEAGAIQVNTVATDPRLVASKVLDRFVRLAV